MTEPSSPGRVLAIAVRTKKNGPMREVDRADAREGGGLTGDLASEPDRGITILSERLWNETLEELGHSLPWHSRRANVLVGGLDFAELIGKTLRLGEVELAIVGETEPCRLMNLRHQGLMQALVPNLRGGLHGRVIKSGTIRVGDQANVVTQRLFGISTG